MNEDADADAVQGQTERERETARERQREREKERVSYRESCRHEKRVDVAKQAVISRETFTV